MVRGGGGGGGANTQKGQGLMHDDKIETDRQTDKYGANGENTYNSMTRYTCVLSSKTSLSSTMFG